jgi:hypothetical protein
VRISQEAILATGNVLVLFSAFCFGLPSGAISSPACRHLVIIRLSTSPSEFGNVLPSVLKLMVLPASLIEYVPQ